MCWMRSRISITRRLPCVFMVTRMFRLFLRDKGRLRVRAFRRIRPSLGCKCFVNTGSVGQPRDGDPRASYLIYEPAQRKITLRRVPYDIGKTQAAIRRRVCRIGWRYV
jgi:hypothetical protein